MRFEFTDRELVRDLEGLRCGDRYYNLTGHKIQLDQLRFNQLFASMVDYTLDDWAQRFLFHQAQYKRVLESVGMIVDKSQKGGDIYEIFHELKDLSSQGKGLETQEKQYLEMQRIMGPMGHSYRGVCLDTIKAKIPPCLDRVREGWSHLNGERSNVYYSVVGAIKDNIVDLGAAFKQDCPREDADPRLPLWRLLAPHRV